MAAVSWKSAVSANWTVTTDWSSGAVPATTDDVTIGIAGAYTVTLTTPAVTVNSIDRQRPKCNPSDSRPRRNRHSNRRLHQQRQGRCRHHRHRRNHCQHRRHPLQQRCFCHRQQQHQQSLHGDREGADQHRDDRPDRRLCAGNIEHHRSGADKSDRKLHFTGRRTAGSCEYQCKSKRRRHFDREQCRACA